jgi:uncharacterized membrane protein YbhN (UPF0104 family)
MSTPLHQSDTDAPVHGVTDVEEYEGRRADAAQDEGKRLRNGIISLVVLVILVGALLLAVPGLRDVADKISDVDPWWIALAVTLEVLSCVGYVLAFRMVFYRIPQLLAIRVALSEMAFGAVLPVGGAGGIAIGAWVAKAKGGSVRRFMERSAVLFLLTSGVNAATLALAGLLVGIGVLHAPHQILLGLLPGLVATGGIALFWAVPSVAARFILVEDSGRFVRWSRTPRTRSSTRRGGCSARSATCGSTSRCCGCRSGRSAPRRRSAR